MLSDCEKVASEPQIDCGLFLVKTGGEERILARFSGKHLARFSYVARGLMLFLSGNMSLVSSDEYERTCPKCHRALPGTKECPHCSRQGGGTAKQFLSMLTPYKKQLSIIFVVMACAAVTTLLNPEIQKHLIDDVLHDRKGTLSEAYFFLSIIFGLSIGMVVINITKAYPVSYTHLRAHETSV